MILTRGMDTLIRFAIAFTHTVENMDMVSHYTDRR